MIFRYSDKPNAMYPQAFPMLEKQKCYIATQKLDGWRTFIIRDTIGKVTKFAHPSWAMGEDKSLFFVSRRGKDAGGPTQIPVSAEIVKAVQELDLPDQTMLDAEWLKRRTMGEVPECIYLLGVLWWDNAWKGGMYEKDRHVELEKVTVNGGPIRKPEVATCEYEEFFNAQKEFPWTEGIVLKHELSKVAGDRGDCKKNKMWIKIKWRDGQDGRTVVA